MEKVISLERRSPLGETIGTPASEIPEGLTEILPSIFFIEKSDETIIYSEKGRVGEVARREGRQGHQTFS